MKKIFVTTLLMMAMQLVVNAQVTLQPAIPAVGLIQKNQLWNVLVINGSKKQYECRLEMVLRDRATGQEVMTGTTGLFTMVPGSKQLNVNLLAPIQYNYFMTGIDSKMQGLLPAGNYTVCYALSSIAIKESNLAEECVQFDTEPLSPPMLIYPQDSAILDVAPTQFSWIPPTPGGMFDRLQYDVIITAIADGQKAEQAIQENVPFYNDGNHFTNMLNYPSSSMAFEKDKWYAWQVTARDDRNYAGKSETWVFKVAPPSMVNTIVEQSPFLKMKVNNPDRGIAPNGVLKISYVNETTDSVITIIVNDISQNKIVTSFDVNIKPGENLIQYNLGKRSSLAEGKLYEARIINSRKERNVVLFELHVYKTKKENN